MSAEARAFVGIILLDLGLVLLLCSWMLAFGLGLRAGLLAAVGLPLMTVGIALERCWARAVVFAVGTTMACGWLCAVLTWD